MTAGGALYTWGQAEAQYPGSHFPGKGLGNDDLALNKLVPTLVPGRLLGGARDGRCHELREELALASAMGTHERLGGGCYASKIQQ